MALQKQSINLNMVPTASFYNVMNCLWANAIFFSQLLTTDLIKNVPAPYFFYCFICELSHCMPLSFSSVLANHVGNIFMVCPKKKMRRVNASRIVAFMEDTKAFFDFSEMNAPRKAMCCYYTSVPSSLSYNPISILEYWANPHPTIIGLSYSCPKSIFNWRSFHLKWVA